MIIVHHLENSRSQRILWLLEELDVPYELRAYKRQGSLLAPPELRKIHPLGKAPVIQDGDRTVAESGAIIDYLVTAYGGGRLVPPEGTAERLSYTYWMYYAEGSAMTPLLLKLVFSMLPGRSPFLVKPVVRMIADKTSRSFIDPQIRLHMDFWESALSRNPWFAGEQFSAADIQMSFPLEAATSRATPGPKRPFVAAFLDRIHSRPAYRRALERGGPYAYAE
ncbi:glutathione S-transferase [Acetobacter nitrogenifigens DSM 23921 = NBRC 105050]|uniref:glutathione transferase n=1 Tax=Acetobacter nitrogenifigens DSM 23921 = NBRC 105050 TaxID=1120919 RepID=A0A511XBS5_9PROT|nr:glutathione S-transferase [Acetobacter nitrogenifigens]GBQ88448.1 glutathione S-transferase [Acetobacter nitrogenifigens DSM 23921 = NBRC 105050]GEN60406.1 glutathione S-transferase [Acetobacter nitrogenifigens DSM 23921 = NBRC 105050]